MASRSRAVVYVDIVPGRAVVHEAEGLRVPKKDLAYQAGLAIRKRILGSDYVDRARADATSFDREWQDFVTRHAWGSVWTRDGIDRRTRSLLTIAILAALGAREELSLHLRATSRTGATRAEVREALMQVAVYAGVPAANAAFRIARSVFAEIDAATAQSRMPAHPTRPQKSRTEDRR